MGKATRIETRGRKPDITKIKAEVGTQWDRLSSSVKRRLSASAPTTKADAKKYVLRVASQVISEATRKVKSRSR